MDYDFEEFQAYGDEEDMEEEEDEVGSTYVHV